MKNEGRTIYLPPEVWVEIDENCKRFSRKPSQEILYRLKILSRLKVEEMFEDTIET